MLSAPMIFWTIRLLNLEVSLKTGELACGEAATRRRQ